MIGRGREHHNVHVEPIGAAVEHAMSLGSQIGEVR